MGFFSWRCAKSDKPIMAEPAVVNSPWAFASKVGVLFKDGRCITGTYSGYGTIDVSDGGELELVEEYDPDEWRMVIKDYYDGESFRDFPKKNDWDRNQGFFYNDEDLEKEFACQSAIPAL